MNHKTKAHIYISIASILFGANYWIAKGLMPDYLTPMQIIFFRVTGALILFWLVQLSFASGKVDKKDQFRLALCGLFGVGINQVLFFQGLALTSPIDTSIIHATSPVMVVIFANIILKEKLNYAGIAGVLAGLAGAILLITDGKEISFDDSRIAGNLMIVTNILFYSLYLVIVKPLMHKYNPLTVMKWVFIWGFIFSTPFYISSVPEINWSGLTASAWGAIIYVIMGTTFFAYLLTTFSLKHLSATAVGYYIYSQPIVAGLIGLIIGAEMPTFTKSLACLIIFAGVYLVNKKPRLKTSVSNQ